jgi:hypothetical protein
MGRICQALQYTVSIFWYASYLSMMSIIKAGTDDDIPPPHMNREPRGGGRVGGNGRSSVGALLYERGEFDMESQIHQLEQEAYSAVLRAFIGQSDTISWVLIRLLVLCPFLLLLYTNAIKTSDNLGLILSLELFCLRTVCFSLCYHR